MMSPGISILIERGGSEFRILLDLTEEELRAFMDDRLADGILQVRQGLVQVKPGYDGVYGQVKIFEKEVLPPKPSSQLNLF